MLSIAKYVYTWYFFWFPPLQRTNIDICRRGKNTSPSGLSRTDRGIKSNWRFGVTGGGRVGAGRAGGHIQIASGKKEGRWGIMQIPPLSGGSFLIGDTAWDVTWGIHEGERVEECVREGRRLNQKLIINQLNPLHPLPPVCYTAPAMLRTGLSKVDDTY